MCDTPDGLAQLQYVLIKSGAATACGTSRSRRASARRQLVVQHGGILWADPHPAGGTRVSFVIPAARQRSRWPS
ncbi:MAG TPA: hypothetical protein VJP03_06130, partial [Actinomycetota bacterium]|nr:hypothetical protein [Actinomycetota bacterium]